jgi:tetratricopeptide (TPR) repeat protein
MSATSLAQALQKGEICTRLERWDEAVAAFEEAAKIDPLRPEIHFNLGNSHVKAAHWDEAISCYQRALALRPDYARARSNLGYVFLEQHRVGEALAQFEGLPEGPDRHYNAGVALSRSGRRDEAMERFRQAITLDSGYGDAYLALSCELFLRGRYEEGWRLLAQPEAHPEREARQLRFRTPKWQGAPLPTGTLLIYEDQGYGDFMQFLRYLPLVQGRLGGGRILLECPPPLSRLVRQSSALGITVVDRGASLPRHDQHIALLDLPFVLQQWAPVSIREPYLCVDAAPRRIWREKLGTDPAFRVGLMWAGNPGLPSDGLRSIPAGRLLPLLRIPGTTFYTLQVKSNDGRPQPLLHAGLVDLTAAITDFADTAALISELDLVITVDTAVAHLAGALGLRVWLLLPLAPDWRWELGRDDTPWYPTMRLFRQRALGDWDSVIQRVAAELASLQ